MSKEDVVRAYLDGDLGRRQFVRRLVALGVSVTAALAYAQMSPSPANASSEQSVNGLVKACQQMPAAGVVHSEFCGA